MRKKLLIAAASRLSFRSNRKPLAFESSDSVGPSYVQWRGWSYAAATVPVPCDTPNPQKGRKKITKHERRALVESFVTIYRTSNAGKFPKATEVRKQVGGCYYYIRQIIQELEYKSKMNSSNSMDETLLEKEQCPMVSSHNTGTVKDRPIQDDSQLLLSDDRETIDAGYKHLEEKKGSQISSWERRLSKDVEIISTPGNHYIASESILLEKCSDEPYPSSLQMPNDVETEEAVSGYSDCVTRPATHLQQDGKEYVSSSFSDKDGTVYGKVPGHGSEFVDMDNHQKMEENCIEKAGYDRKEQATLEDLYKEPSHSSMRVPNNVASGKDVSSYSSESVAPERHLLKEVEHASASLIGKSDSNHCKAQSHYSEFVDMENHPIVVEEKSFKKAGYERKEQDADLLDVDGPNHKMDQSQGSIELAASKVKNSNNRETNVAVVSAKSTLWGNLKSFADGVINIWRKL